MNKKETVKKIWQECFEDSEKWINMYFTAMYSDRDALVLDYNGETVSSMLLLHYNLNLWGCNVPVGYVSGAATLPHHRHKGYMTRLMDKAVKEAYERGDFMVALIPASRELYFYYDRFGFTTLFFVKEEHYTSLHKFNPVKSYTAAGDTDINTLYRAFHELEESHNGRIMHGFNDFKAILEDLRFDGGTLKTVTSVDKGIEAIALYHRGDDGEIIVKEILSCSSDATLGALSHIRKDNFGMPITVLSVPADEDIMVEAKGMGRIVNVLGLLKVIAVSHPGISRQYIKVTDDLIGENNHIFCIDGSEVNICDDFKGSLDIDVDVKTLAGILFNTPATSGLFHLPTKRLFMSLMME